MRLVGATLGPACRGRVEGAAVEQLPVVRSGCAAGIAVPENCVEFASAATRWLAGVVGCASLYPRRCRVGPAATTDAGCIEKGVDWGRRTVCGQGSWGVF